MEPFGRGLAVAAGRSQSKALRFHSNEHFWLLRAVLLESEGRKLVLVVLYSDPGVKTKALTGSY